MTHLQSRCSTSILFVIKNNLAACVYMHLHQTSQTRTCSLSSVSWLVRLETSLIVDSSFSCKLRSSFCSPSPSLLTSDMALIRGNQSRLCSWMGVKEVTLLINNMKRINHDFIKADLWRKGAVDLKYLKMLWVNIYCILSWHMTRIYNYMVNIILVYLFILE